MVDWDKYKTAEVGKKETTTVSEVREGVQNDFRTDGYWDKVESSKEEIKEMKQSPAIEVVAANGARLVMNLPKGEIVSPKSNLGLWKATYGEYPVANQEITTKTDENGFQRIVLEK